MEKATIKTAAKITWNGKEFLKITLEDGRIGTSYDLELENKIGTEIELDVTPAKKFDDVQQYYFKLPKQPKENKWQNKAAPKDMTFEKRKVALECATLFYQPQSKETAGIEVIRLAENFYDWLNQN